MKKLKQHITLLLLLVFILPSVYQNVHIYEHVQSDVHCCAHDVQQCDAYDNWFVQHFEEEECPVCEFEFSLNHIPQLQNDIFVFRYVLSFIQCLNVEKYSSQSYLIPAPRGPPSV